MYAPLENCSLASEIRRYGLGGGVRIIDYQCTRIDLNRYPHLIPSARPTYGIATKACRVAIFFIEMPVERRGRWWWWWET